MILPYFFHIVLYFPMTPSIFERVFDRAVELPRLSLCAFSLPLRLGQALGCWNCRRGLEQHLRAHDALPHHNRNSNSHWSIVLAIVIVTLIVTAKIIDLIVIYSNSGSNSGRMIVSVTKGKNPRWQRGADPPGLAQVGSPSQALWGGCGRHGRSYANISRCTEHQIVDTLHDGPRNLWTDPVLNTCFEWGKLVLGRREKGQTPQPIDSCCLKLGILWFLGWLFS